MRKAEINELLCDVKETINIINNKYPEVNEDLSSKEFLKIKIKHALEDMRNCLDYIANDIYEKFFYPNDGSKKPRIYFPYGKDENDFKSMAGRCFKNLQEINSKLYNAIISIQSFKSDSMWLYNLCIITNTNKHEKLMDQDRKTEADLRVNGVNAIHFEGLSGRGRVEITGCSFNGVKQNGDIIIENGTVDFGNNDDISEFDVDTKFYFAGTDINCIELVKESYFRITEFVNEVYKILEE